MRHAWILAGIGLVAGLAGVVAYYTIGGAELGPAWYAISIPVEAIPCVWLGGRLAASRRSVPKSKCNTARANHRFLAIEQDLAISPKSNNEGRRHNNDAGAFDSGAESQRLEEMPC